MRAYRSSPDTSEEALAAKQAASKQPGVHQEAASNAALLDELRATGQPEEEQSLLASVSAAEGIARGDARSPAELPDALREKPSAPDAQEHGPKIKDPKRDVPEPKREPQPPGVVQPEPERGVVRPPKEQPAPAEEVAEAPKENPAPQEQAPVAQEKEPSVPATHENPAPAPQEREPTLPAPQEQEHQGPSEHDRGTVAPAPQDKDNPAPKDRDRETPSPGTENPAPKDRDRDVPVPKDRDRDTPSPGTENPAPKDRDRDVPTPKDRDVEVDRPTPGPQDRDRDKDPRTPDLRVVDEPAPHRRFPDSEIVETRKKFQIEVRREEVWIYDPRKKPITRIWGDPHVDENADGKDDWHFGEDSTFQLPDGTKVCLDTEPNAKGEWFVVGVDIIGGASRFHYGRGDVPGLKDDGFDWDAAHDDRSKSATAGVFALQENGQWAIQGPDGGWYDVKNETWEEYQRSRDVSFGDKRVDLADEDDVIGARKPKKKGGGYASDTIDKWLMPWEKDWGDGRKPDARGKTPKFGKGRNPRRMKGKRPAPRKGKRR